MIVEEDDEFDGCLGYENDKIWIQSDYISRASGKAIRLRCYTTDL